jgi:ethanolamine permease
MFLNGFQAAIHAIEERGRAISLRRSVLSMVLGIGAGAAFYAIVILAASAAVPWKKLVHADLPAAYAFSASLPSGVLGTVVLVAATLSLVKTWNAIVFMASRLIFAQARLGYLPAMFARISVPARVPAVAITAVTLLTILLVPFGRGAVVPIVNMCSMCLAVTYVLSIGILIRLRSSVGNCHKAPAFEVPGGPWLIGAALIAAIVMASAAILEPAIRIRGVPLEWELIAGWGLCGVIAWVFVARKVVSMPVPATSDADNGR